MIEFNDRLDGKDWARKIMRRQADGEKINRYPLHSAREVLGVPEPAPVVRRPIGPKVLVTRGGVPVGTAHDPLEPAQAMTPAEAFYAAEQAARSASGYSSAATTCA